MWSKCVIFSLGKLGRNQKLKLKVHLKKGLICGANLKISLIAVSHVAFCNFQKLLFNYNKPNSDYMVIAEYLRLNMQMFPIENKSGQGGEKCAYIEWRQKTDFSKLP